MSAPLTRRSLTAGLGAAVAAIPALGLSAGAREAPVERVQRLAKELEAAMRELHPGVEVETLSWNLDGGDGTGMKPVIFVVAHTPRTRGGGLTPHRRSRGRRKFRVTLPARRPHR
jgi:predicted metallopeptidase